ADLDRDGDLDVVTVSLEAPGAATDAHILLNDGTGTLVDPVINFPLGPLARKTVRVVNAYDRKKPTLVVWGVDPGNVPALAAFDVASGFTPVALPGVDPVAGDWEAADMNSDGYVDLVALGTDGGGNAALRFFSGSAAGWTRDDVDVYASATLADVDLGDFDADGLPDAFVMFEDAGLNRVSKGLTHLPGAAYATAAAATSADHQIAFGDGFI